MKFLKLILTGATLCSLTLKAFATDPPNCKSESVISGIPISAKGDSPGLNQLVNFNERFVVDYTRFVSTLSSYGDTLKALALQPLGNEFDGLIEFTYNLAETLEAFKANNANDSERPNVYEIACAVDTKKCEVLISDRDKLSQILAKASFLNHGSLSGEAYNKFKADFIELISDLNFFRQTPTTEDEQPRSASTPIAEINDAGSQSGPALKEALIKPLLLELSSNPDGNSALSAASLNDLLGFLGTTYSSQGQELIRNYTGSPYEDLIQQGTEALNIETPGVTVRTARNLFVAQSLSSLVNPGFYETIENSAGLASLYNEIPAFFDNTSPITAANEINNWVSSETNGLVNDVIQPDMITQESLAFFISTLYFNGQWDAAFDKSLTHEKSFNTLDANGNYSVAPVSTMYKNETDIEFATQKIDNISVITIKLPFKGQTHSLYVTFPFKRTLTDSPNDFIIKGDINSISPKAVHEFMSRPNSYDLKLELLYDTEFTIPRFQITDKLSEIKTVLSNNGYQHLFEAGAMSHFSQDERVKLAFILQAVNLTINESGGQAAAVTVGGVQRESAISHEVTRRINVDSPFVYAIVDEQTKKPLFEGIVTNPQYDDKGEPSSNNTSQDVRYNIEPNHSFEPSRTPTQQSFPNGLNNLTRRGLRSSRLSDLIGPNNGLREGRAHSTFEGGLE